MPTIPINPASIASAGVYTAPTNAVPINLCKPPKEGVKALPMQFAFNQFPGFLVQFPNAPNAPMSQLCALYIDATGSDFDVSVYFPDTGYSARINSRGSRLIPVITSATNGSLPSFYVLLDSSGTLTNDIVNIIALNQFIPEFEANELTNTLSYGYGQFFIPQPTFTQSANFSSQFTALTGTLINANQWYITALDISIEGQTTSAADIYTIILRDAGTAFFRFIINLTSTLGAQKVVSLGGLNYQSSGSGSMTWALGGNAGNLAAWNSAFNILGGILVP